VTLFESLFADEVMKEANGKLEILPLLQQTSDVLDLESSTRCPFDPHISLQLGGSLKILNEDEALPYKGEMCLKHMRADCTHQ